MTLHKLAAGSGYTYLTRQVAAHDRPSAAVGLAAYYEEKGESPGRWLGGGLVGLDLADGGVVTEEQMMKLLFGQGRHPRSREPDAVARGWGSPVAPSPPSLRPACARR